MLVPPAPLLFAIKQTSFAARSPSWISEVAHLLKLEPGTTTQSKIYGRLGRRFSAFTPPQQQATLARPGATFLLAETTVGGGSARYNWTQICNGFEAFLLTQLNVNATNQLGSPRIYDQGTEAHAKRVR